MFRNTWAPECRPSVWRRRLLQQPGPRGTQARIRQAVPAALERSPTDRHGCVRRGPRRATERKAARSSRSCPPRVPCACSACAYELCYHVRPQFRNIGSAMANSSSSILNFPGMGRSSDQIDVARSSRAPRTGARKATYRGSATTALGKIAVKVAPLPGTLSIIRRPRWRFRMCFTSDSPRPVPPCARLSPTSTR